MRRGEIRWYRFGRPDKTRPVLILTRDSVIDVLGEVTVAPITSTARGIPSEVAVTSENGLHQDSVVNLDHVQTVPRGRIGALIAALPAHRMRDVQSALLFALGFDD